MIRIMPLSSTDSRFRLECAELEDRTDAVLVLSSFQEDDNKKFSTGGVCRAIASFWINAGIAGKKGNAFATFMKIAELDDPAKRKAAEVLQVQQMQSYIKALDDFSDKLKKLSAKVPTILEKLQELDLLILSDSKHKPPLDELFGRYETAVAGITEAEKFVATAQPHLLAVVLSLGAAASGVDVARLSSPSKPTLVPKFVTQPKDFVSKAGFYYFGVEAEHGMSIYYDGKQTTYFYDANTGLWRIPKGEKGFSQFLPAYFKVTYKTKYDKKQVQLLLIPKLLDAGVSAALASAKSTLDEFRK